MGDTVETEPPKTNSVILFHLPRTVKETVSLLAKKQGLSITRLLNDLIGGYITAQTPPPPPQKKKTGRGNVDTEQIELVKQFMRQRHPDGVRIAEIAVYVEDNTGRECTPARAARLLDILSGGSDGRDYSFIVYEDDFVKPVLFYIGKDFEVTGSHERPADSEYKHWNEATCRFLCQQTPPES
jgi:hypothetical protein